MKRKQVPTKEEILNKLDYDPDTGYFTWKRLTAEHFACERWAAREADRHNAFWAGKVAGGPGTNGYWELSLNGENWKVHVLAMVVLERYDEAMLTDHANGDVSDNRASNLRSVTFLENRYNRKSLGVVSYDAARDRFSARVTHHGKKLRVGRHRTRGLAMVALAKWSLRVHGVYSPFLRKVQKQGLSDVSDR